MHRALASVIRTCTSPPHAHSVTIHLYHFKGSVEHRSPLVHPDCPLELICTSTVPLRRHATAVWVVSEAAETPSSSPLHGWKERTRCTRIHTGRLSDIHWGGLHTSWVLWPSALRAAMAIFSGSELQKNRISYLCSPDARPRGYAYCSKGSAHMPKAWEGVPGWLGQQGVTVKKDIRYRRSDIRYRILTYDVNF